MKYPKTKEVKNLKRYRIIILESVDGGGKTTLGLYLSKKLKKSYYHDPLDNSTGETNFLNYYKNISKKSFPEGGILDRSFYSGIVYDEVFEKKTHPRILKPLEREYLDCCVIFCKPTVRIQEDRPEVYEMEGNTEKLYKKFEKLWSKSNLDIYQWDYTTGVLKEWEAN